MSNRYGSLTGITSHYGTPSLGVLGSVIRANTATGLYGAGLLYNDWQDASDNTRELRGLVTAYSTPAAPVVNEDGSIESWAVPADGTHTVTYQLYVDGVATGAPVTASVLVGAAPGINVTITGTVPHAGAYSAAAAVAAPSAGIGVTVAATVTHAGAFSASAVVTVGISVTVGGTVVHAGSYSAAASTGAPPPFLEPVTLAEAKTAARLELSDVGMDSLIEGLITMAREQAEQITGRLYRDTTERVELTDWPASTDVLYVAEPRAVAITYWDGAAWASLNGSAFEWAGQGAGTVIAPAVGGSWPALGERAVGARVRVDITAGPTSASQVAESVKLYIKALVSVWINNPDAAQRGAMQTNPMFDRLLDRERLWH